MLKDVHLMVTDPLDKLHDYVRAGADIITVHLEACRHPHRALQALGQMTNANDPARGIVRGLALNPGTPVESLTPLLAEVDMVTLLAVSPGFAGQSYIPQTSRRIRQVLDLAVEAGTDVLVCVDGGVKRDNIAQIAHDGADIIVTGSAVFDSKDPAANAHFMLQEIKRA
jgi:ribulose-phosphate 3-epimerase